MDEPPVAENEKQIALESLDDCPWAAWPMYFPAENYEPASKSDQLVRRFLEEFEEQMTSTPQVIEEAIKNCFTPVHYKDLQNMDPNFAAFFIENPELILNALGVAIYQIVWRSEYKSALLDNTRINPRIVNYHPMSHIRQLKADKVGKLIAVTGTVVRVSNVKPKLMQMNFVCARCSAALTVHFVDGKYAVPEKCTTGQCRSKTFTPKRDTARTVDWQRVRLQELLTDEHEAGRVPRTVECELTDDLVDSCVPGDVVSVTGVVKVIKIDAAQGRSRSNTPLLYIYLDANSVTKQKSVEARMAFSNSLMDVVNAVRNFTSDTFRWLVHSICPGIFGHNMVKAGLVLTLFGGVQRFYKDKNRISVRGDPHLLMVGDPGMGKSQMLKAVAELAPRGVFVGGTSSSASGLTVTILKEPGSGDYVLEAGALVLGDMGVCCIDEFDKMVSQHEALLEAMEQQSISVAKAGIVCNLPSRTSIIAAANPVGGHYNKGKTVSENLKMSAAILSRFDLVFILIDKPDQQKDKMVSEHILAAKRQRTDPNAVSKAKDVDLDGSAGPDESMPLADRLRLRQNEVVTPAPPPSFRTYLAYARQTVFPKLSAGAKQVLRDFYLKLRQQSTSVNSAPITTRQLESMIRLAEARARVDLREEVTRRDAEDVVAIMKESLLDVHENADGFIDFTRNGVSGGKRLAQAKAFIHNLKRTGSRPGDEFNVADLIHRANAYGFLGDPTDVISFLNEQGFILKAGTHIWKLA